MTDRAFQAVLGILALLILACVVVMAGIALEWAFS